MVAGRAMVLLWVGLVAVVFCRSELSAAEWASVTGARVLFTDNVFELSAARRLALSEDPSQPVIVSLSQPSDVVGDPSVDLKTTSWSSLRKPELSFKAHGFLYTYHPIFGHGDYRFQVNQQVASRTDEANLSTRTTFPAASSFVSFGALIQLLAPLSLELIRAFREKEFTADIVGDPLRGNVDDLHQGTAELHYDLSASVTVTVGSNGLSGHPAWRLGIFQHECVPGGQYRF